MSDIKIAVAASIALCAVLIFPMAAHAGCSSGSGSSGTVWTINTTCENPPASGNHHHHGPTTPKQHLQPACPGTESGRAGPGSCTYAAYCGTHEVPYFVMELQHGHWVQTGITCSASGTGGAAKPTVTPGLVLHAFEEITLPTYASIAQPADKTLVNFDTIFYTRASGFVRTVTLLGQRVELHIRPSRYTWQFGDGSSLQTTTPGAAYPSKDVVHRYQRAHVTVRHRVVITWSATFRVNGGPSRPVPGTVTRAGPRSPLRISEATPVLSGYGH